MTWLLYTFAHLSRNMKVIVGLGNPGKEYEHTRHNAGFTFIDFLAKKLSLSLNFDKKFNVEYVKAEIIQNGVAEDICLIKTMSFMNNSGITLRNFLNYFYADILEEDEGNHLIVAHDDLDLDLGQFKLQKGKGPKVHNGLTSIYKHLGHKNFWHLRLGIDSRAGNRNIEPSNYVLMKMNQIDQEKLEKVIAEVFSCLFSA